MPADADPFLRLMAARAWVRAGSERDARFLLAPGEYTLVTEAGAIVRTVELGHDGSTVTLD